MGDVLRLDDEPVEAVVLIAEVCGGIGVISDDAGRIERELGDGECGGGQRSP